jgi:HTH-type transcriptional regulator/antitoxin MqsA
MVYRSKVSTFDYLGVPDKVRVTGWWCDQCGESILTGEDLKKYSLAFQTLKARVDQVLSPAEVAKVRERLGLSQRKAGELLGGGPRAFYKYESGEQTPSVPMSHLLRLLDHDPNRIQEIPEVKKKVRLGHG